MQGKLHYKDMYKVTEKDLIRDIKDFPIEVIQKMVDEQVRQGNPADVSVFQEQKHKDSPRGGFDWYKTTDGEDFWGRVVVGKNFDLFFAKYTKEQEDDFWIDPKGRMMLVWESVNGEENAKEALVIAKLPGKPYCPYIVAPGTSGLNIKEGLNYHISIYQYAKQIPAKEGTVELTIDQIADKFGISVDRLKIKK